MVMVEDSPEIPRFLGGDRIVENSDVPRLLDRAPSRNGPARGKRG